jgi:hypothetical protein
MDGHCVPTEAFRRDANARAQHDRKIFSAGAFARDGKS